MEHLSVERNFLIAKFMGYTYPDILNMSFAMSVGELHNYHQDWNKLMHVVEKIEALKSGDEKYDLVIESNKCRINHSTQLLTERHGGYFTCLVSNEKTTKIESVYDAVIQFLQWYTTQTKSTD